MDYHNVMMNIGLFTQPHSHCEIFRRVQGIWPLLFYQQDRILTTDGKNDSDIIS